MAEPLDDLTKALAALLGALPDHPLDSEDITGQPAKKARRHLNKAIERLRQLADQLDPIQHPPFVFDPTSPEIIGGLIGRALLEQGRQPMASIAKFYGSGVYALYYRGSFPAYKPIRGKETPIYVGKADPPTPDAKSFIEQGPRLATRLAEHAKSIRAAGTTLHLEDFDCRFLVVQSGWQRSAEDYLLNHFRPIWNSKTCFGFGKHGDDPSTRGNTRSPWDSLHPGRPWATKGGKQAESADNRTNQRTDRRPLSPVSATVLAATTSTSRFATTCARVTGTALPSCRMASVHDPSNSQLSGKVCNRAHSRTEK